MKKLFILSLLAVSSCLSPANAQLTGRWYSYGDYIYDKATSMGGTAHYFDFPIWHNPAAYIGYPAPTGYLINTFTSVGTSFAPRLGTWNDVPTFGSSIKVGPNDVYSIDSIRVTGSYLRNNLRPAVKDTLKFAFVYGDGTPTSNLPASSFYSVGTASYLTVPNMLFDAATNMAGRQSTSTPAPYVHTVVLSNTDTATNFQKSYRLPAPFVVPVGQIAAASLSFRTGDATYTPGDTLFYASGARKYGVFTPGVAYFEDNLGNVTWPPYDVADSNIGYFRQESLTWSGLYAPTWAWTSGGSAPTSLQYALIDFHVTCPNCELNDTIAGHRLVCNGTTSTLTHTVSSGTWTSSNTAVATIGATTGIVAALTTGTTNITYTVGTGNKAYITLTVNAALVPGSLMGASSVCAGTSLTLTPSVPSGTWSSSTPGVATVNSAGVVTGLAAGTANISYTVSAACGTASATHIVSINALPVTGGIMGTPTTCVGGTTTFLPGNSGGTWATVTGKASVSSSGIVSGISTGIDTVKYNLSNTCGTDIARRVVTVVGLPTAGTVEGPDSACLRGVIILVDTTASITGAWSASNANATVAGGMVTGITAGTVTISYTVSNTCGPATATKDVVVYECPTDVADLAIGGISLYPNPVSGSLTISATGKLEHITMWNVTGQKVADMRVTGATAIIDMTTLPAGIYAIEVNDGKIVRVVRQ